MAKTLKEKITYCAGLLNRSILDDNLKDAILDNIDVLEEADIDRLCESLEREQMELTKADKQLKEIEAPVSAEMDKIERQQSALAAKLTDEFATEVIQEILKRHGEK
jgi:Skp family chaperone for outer membrane proteins